MTHYDWREAVAALRQLTEAATPEQRELAQVVGLELPENLPRLVAAARLQRALAEPLALEPPAPLSEYQRAAIEELRTEEDSDCAPSDYQEANAWITFLRFRLRRRTLENLQVKPGDIVQLGDSDEELGEISSIGSDGRIYFKGGLGRGAWPDQVAVRTRKDDDDAESRQLRAAAANQRAARTRTDRWSRVKQNEIREYEVRSRLTESDVERLQEVVDAAENERPIQKLVESHPQLLAALIGGEPRYCIPHARLGAEFVPDFLVGSVDSLGIHWLLVELETPQSDVTLRNDNQLDKHGRKGVSQIEEWREWLLQNLDYARRSRREKGLGLPDIRPASSGLVIVGRRYRLHDNSSAVRNPLRERSAIRVHTYDWWLEQLRGTLRYHGPWAANPYIIHEDHEPSPW